MNNRDFKYIFKRVVIGLTIAFILFNINKCNAYAYVYKGEVWNTMDQYSVSDYVNANSTKSIPFNINNSNINSVSVPYDLIIFKFNYFRFAMETPGTIDTMSFCDRWSQSGTTFTCTHFSSGSVLDSSSEINIYSSSFYITATAYWGTNGDTLSCYMTDDLKDMIVCPIKKTTDTNLTKLSISISSYYKMYYRFELSGLKYYYNYESTEIVNGLTGVENQQQQINNTLNNSNVNGANTDTNNALSSIENSVSSTLDNTIGANQLFTIKAIRPVKIILIITYHPQLVYY